MTFKQTRTLLQVLNGLLARPTMEYTIKSKNITLKGSDYTITRKVVGQTEEERTFQITITTPAKIKADWSKYIIVISPVTNFLAQFYYIPITEGPKGTGQATITVDGHRTTRIAALDYGWDKK